MLIVGDVRIAMAARVLMGMQSLAIRPQGKK